MSYRAMLKHRCKVKFLNETFISGVPHTEWVERVTGLRCFLDLNFIRRGKDPMWTPEAGRPADRTGVLFLLPDAPVKSGDRIYMTVGPPGVFQVEGAVDEAWRPTDKHHLELGVIEVPQQLSAGQA